MHIGYRLMTSPNAGVWGLFYRFLSPSDDRRLLAQKSLTLAMPSFPAAPRQESLQAPKPYITLLDLAEMMRWLLTLGRYVIAHAHAERCSPQAPRPPI